MSPIEIADLDSIADGIQYVVHHINKMYQFTANNVCLLSSQLQSIIVIEKESVAQTEREVEKEMNERERAL